MRYWHLGWGEQERQHSLWAEILLKPKQNTYWCGQPSHGVPVLGRAFAGMQAASRHCALSAGGSSVKQVAAAVPWGYSGPRGQSVAEHPEQGMPKSWWVFVQRVATPSFTDVLTPVPFESGLSSTFCLYDSGRLWDCNETGRRKGSSAVAIPRGAFSSAPLGWAGAQTSKKTAVLPFVSFSRVLGQLPELWGNLSFRRLQLGGSKTGFFLAVTMP